jgi:hypothetical protein
LPQLDFQAKRAKLQLKKPVDHASQRNSQRVCLSRYPRCTLQANVAVHRFFFLFFCSPKFFTCLLLPHGRRDLLVLSPLISAALFPQAGIRVASSFAAFNATASIQSE